MTRKQRAFTSYATVLLYAIIILVALFFSSCKVNYENCRRDYPCPECPPSLIIDSTFVIDRIVHIDSHFVSGNFDLDSLAFRWKKVYEDSLLTIKAMFIRAPTVGGKVDLGNVSYEVQMKARNIAIKAANIDSLISLLSFYKTQRDSFYVVNQNLVLEEKDLVKQIEKGKPFYQKWWFGPAILLALSIGALLAFKLKA